jgi:Family of unknown function (DUF6263)
MRFRRGGRGGVVMVALACLAPGWSQTARAQVKLEYKFPEGKKLTYKTSWNPFQTLTLAGQEIQSNERKTVVWTQTTGKRRGDATLPVDMRVESLKTTLRLQGGIDLSFDSSKPGGKIDDPEFAPLRDIYKLESQVAYTVVLDGQNKVKAIEGTEALRDKAARLDPIAREQVRSLIEAGPLKAQFEQEHRFLPDGPARPGESWERTETVDYGGSSLTIRKKYEYAGTEKRGDKALDKITIKVLEVKCPPPDPKSPLPLKATKSDLKVESSEGTILFDREAGRLVESRERVELTGGLTFSAQGQEQRIGFDLTLRTEVQLQSGGK